MPSDCSPLLNASSLSRAEGVQIIFIFWMGSLFLSNEHKQNRVLSESVLYSLYSHITVGYTNKRRLWIYLGRDERVANAIHAKFTSDSLPSQLQLIKEVRRTEEDFRCVPQKRDSKKAFAHGHHANGESSILTNIQSQMQLLQQQMSQLQMKPAPTPAAPSPPSHPPTTGHHNSSARPAISNNSPMSNQPQRVFICFNCGRSDGHRRRNCPYPSDHTSGKHVFRDLL